MASRLGYRHVELDALFHQPNWQPLPDDQFIQIVEQALQGDGWIVEGSYSAVRPLVREQSDMVIWLDLPRAAVMRQLIPRTLRRLVLRKTQWNGNRERWENFQAQRQAIHLGLGLDQVGHLSATLRGRDGSVAPLNVMCGWTRVMPSTVF
nr:hypothetical protein [Stutzerimonas stutzeri]